MAAREWLLLRARVLRHLPPALHSLKADNRASDLLPIIEESKGAGAVSLRQIAAGLNAKGIKTARSGEWSREQVRRVLERL